MAAAARGARRGRAARLALALLPVLCACAGAPVPAPAPELEAHVEHRAGSWRRGFRDPDTEAGTDGAWVGRLRCLHLQPETAAGGAWQPLLTQVELITAEPEGDLLKPTSILAGAVTLAVSADPAAAATDQPTDERPPRPALLAEATAALSAGATTEFTVRWRRLAAAAQTAGYLGLRVDRDAADTARIALTLASDWRSRDVLLLRERHAPGSSLRLRLPLGGPGDTLLVELDLQPPPADPDALTVHRQRAQAALDQLTEQAAARAAAAAEPVRTAGSLRLDVALDATAEPSRARSAMRHLAAVVAAPLAEDFAVVGDQQGIQRVTATVREGASGSPEPGAVALLLERATLELLASRLEQEPLPLAVDSVLLRRVGGVGRFPDLLRDAAADCDSLAALDRTLMESNQRLLRDSNPAHRVRAFDWLRRRGAAPQGYDPLGPLAERRAALARMPTAPTTGESDR